MGQLFLLTGKPLARRLTMKTRQLSHAVTLLLLSLPLISALNPQLSTAQPTTIDPVNRYAYGADFGWLDWYADVATGAVIGSYVCSGYIYSANVGWINLGSGSPTNEIQYQNLSGDDFGVNLDSQGNLSGLAWGANIGWINFTNSGAPRVNLLTGQFSGYAWSANCGWISLSNAVAYVQTDTIEPGTLDTNGLPIAWELTYFGQTGLNPAADPTGKGMTLLEDYLAGTDPTNADSVFLITDETFSTGGTNAELTWDSVPTRFYSIQDTPDLTSPVWTDSGLGLITPSSAAATAAAFTATNAPNRFYRVQAIRPLAPILRKRSS